MTNRTWIASLNLATALAMHAGVLRGAEYWVNQAALGASDSNAGTKASPWLTVGNGAAAALPGDIVHIQGPAVYAERVILTRSGTNGAPITFKGESYPTILGQWMGGGVQRIRYVGLAFSQTTSNYPSGALNLDGSSFNQVLDCTFVATLGSALRAWPPCNNNVIRSNYFNNIGFIGTQITGADAIQMYGTNNLIEYNVILRAADRVNMAGSKNVIRNNYMGPMLPGDIYPDPHIDLFQLDSPADGLTYNIFERNYSVSNMLANSHGGIWSSTTNYLAINHHFIYRQNVLDSIGSYAVICVTFPHMKLYNNTWNRARGFVGASDGVADFDTYSSNCLSLNNIWNLCNSNLAHLYLLDGTTTSTFTNDYDLNYLSGTILPVEPHGVVGDPLFIPGGGFHLSSASPAIAKAGGQTFCTKSATGTNRIAVFDPGVFSDGFQIVDGDKIVVGTNAAVTITNIDYAKGLLSVSGKVTCQVGSKIFLDGTQDIGAYRYLSNGYDYGVAITSPTNGSVLSGTNILTASVNNSAVVRFVKFYVDGLEVGTANAFPYALSVSFTPNQHVIEARAYALYADPKLAASAIVLVNPSQPPAAPTGLQVR
jgi:hypothetical protein